MCGEHGEPCLFTVSQRAEKEWHSALDVAGRTPSFRAILRNKKKLESRRQKVRYPGDCVRDLVRWLEDQSHPEFGGYKDGLMVDHLRAL